MVLSGVLLHISQHSYLDASGDGQGSTSFDLTYSHHLVGLVVKAFAGEDTGLESRLQWVESF